MQGRGTEESGVRGGEGRDAAAQPQRKSAQKNAAVYSLIVGLRGI